MLNLNTTICIGSIEYEEIVALEVAEFKYNNLYRFNFKTHG